MKGKKTGGRVAGEPNKVTKTTRLAIAGLLERYQAENKEGVSLMYQDFLNLDPRDRITIAEKFMQYTTPKMQSIQIDPNAETKITIDQKLIQLAKVPGVDV